MPPNQLKCSYSELSNKVMKAFICVILFVLTSLHLYAEDGHNLWLRNKSTGHVNVICSQSSATLNIAILELQQGWQGKDGATVILAIKHDKAIKGDGFKLSSDGVQANTESGILYGVYELLRRQQTGQPVEDIICNPSYALRILNHWDNPDGSVERGYAGNSIFWHKDENSLAVTEQDRILWQEYARANASIGINGTVLNNVNAAPIMLTEKYLERAKAITAVLRPYGIKTYLSVKFSSPTLIGGLNTSDPLNPDVTKWWEDKVKEIYGMNPDFGGFLVKASSEGQPGPQDYGRTHADGANMLADVLKPFGGIVMWRAFVYSPTGKDRAGQAYKEFKPLDGMFHDNVIVQVKNGPVDFQPREPFNPLFGAMKITAVMPEFQITQEYLGQSVHLVFLAPMWEECLQSETYQEGEGSTVARCTDGSVYQWKHTAIAGVANVGLDTNWCGHPFAQANWYAFGRLAWNNSLTSERIADEWIKLTYLNGRSGQKESADFSGDWTKNFLAPVKQMMLQSREAAVDYMMPLGFHHLFSADEHYGPGPWWAPAGVRKDWTPPYYHRADTGGVGFDRTRSGSDAVSQYHEPLGSQYNDLKTCPEIYLLWFHHLPWDYKMQSGHTLWEEICYHYDKGLQKVREFQKTWDKVEQYIDNERFAQTQNKLRSQCRNAQIWKDACLLYFQTFSREYIPYDIERPVYDLDYLINRDMK
jgi:alpha-glucuronidase